jgi:hypothetical protein
MSCRKCSERESESYIIVGDIQVSSSTCIRLHGNVTTAVLNLGSLKHKKYRWELMRL